MKRVVSILLLLITCSCSTLPRTLARSAVQSKSRFATISLVGDNFNCTVPDFGGVSPFLGEGPPLSSDSPALPGQLSRNMSEFSVDHTITEAADVRMHTDTGATPVRAAYDEQQLDYIYSYAPFTKQVDPNRVQTYVSQLMEKNNLDYLLLFTRNATYNHIIEADNAPLLDTLGCYTEGSSTKLYYFFSAHLIVFKRDVGHAVADRIIRVAWDTGFYGWYLRRIANTPEETAFRGRKLKEAVVLSVAIEVDQLNGKAVKLSDLRRNPPKELSHLYEPDSAAD